MVLEKSPQFATLLQMARALILFLLPLLALAADDPAAARERHNRSAAARRAFKRENPCPATGKPTGPCPGYIIDHVIPLACGGEDAPENMQWQTREEAREKDKTERKNCRK